MVTQDYRCGTVDRFEKYPVVDRVCFPVFYRKRILFILYQTVRERQAQVCILTEPLAECRFLFTIKAGENLYRRHLSDILMIKF
jgi:hypothetical protein